MKLNDLNNIPFRLSTLDAVYPSHKALAGKANRMENSGDLIRIKRGMYVVNPEITGTMLNDFLIANHLNGPSYVSTQTALRYYGLIPENVTEITSMTTGLAKTFSNNIGTFRYIHCSDRYFPIGVKSISEGCTTFLIASPEKALCDLIVTTRNLNLRYRSEIREYIEEYLRIDMDDIKNFDITILQQCVETGKKKNMISQLIKIIEDERDI